MVAMKAVLFLGVVCFAAFASAQTTDFASELPAAAAGDFETGSYLVNGTGVVYDAENVVFYLNGTAVGTAPNPHAEGPGMDDSHTHMEKPDDMHKMDKTGPAPEASGDMLDDIMMKLEAKPDPLYNVVIGRRLLR